MMTVLLATYNGADTLRRVLEAHSRLLPPMGGWRLVVVDNGSTDSSPRILGDFAGRLPLTHLREPTPGKNHALNRGLEGVEGDLVVFTDDDVLPREDWLRQMRGVADVQSGFDVFGGSIVPRWEVAPPAWLLRCVPLDVTYSLTDTGRADGPVEPGLVFGPNMAIRSRVFARGFRFDPTIGPNRRTYAMGSETELTKRLARSGSASWHCGAAVVEHIVRPHQMRRRWVLRRAVRFGRGQWRTNLAPQAPTAPRLFGVPRYMMFLLARQAGRAFAAQCLRSDVVAFRERWELSYMFGVALEARRDARRAARPLAGASEARRLNGEDVGSRR